MWRSLLVSFISCLRKRQTDSPKLPPPSTTDEISYTPLYVFLRKKFPDAAIYMSREIYRLPNGNDIRVFLAADKTDHQKYARKTYRCSDFATRLHGQFKVPDWADLAFGKIWTDAHALNCFVDRKMHFFYAEPQTDKLRVVLEVWQGSKIRFIEI